MKYVLLVVVILVALWLARGGRRALVSRDSAQSNPLPQHEDMVACAQCGLHLPRSEALPGRGGTFCGEAHRSIFERSHS